MTGPGGNKGEGASLIQTSEPAPEMQPMVVIGIGVDGLAIFVGIAALAIFSQPKGSVSHRDRPAFGVGGND